MGAPEELFVELHRDYKSRHPRSELASTRFPSIRFDTQETR